LHRERAEINYLLALCLMIGIGFGSWLSMYRFEEVKQDFLEKMPEERAASLQAALPENIQKQLDEQKKKEDERKFRKRIIKQIKKP